MFNNLLDEVIVDISNKISKSELGKLLFEKICEEFEKTYNINNWLSLFGPYTEIQKHNNKKVYKCADKWKNTEYTKSFNNKSLVI